MTGGSICLLYICIVLDLAVGVDSMQDICCSIDWEDLCCLQYIDIVPWYSCWCSGMQWHLCSNDWGSICPLYICIVLDLSVGLVLCKASMLDWLGRIYAGHFGTNVFGVMVFKASMLSIDWGSICLLYIGIVLDLAVGVEVCKTSVLNWLGRAMHCAMVIYNIQGIYAWLTVGVHLWLLYMGIVLDLAVGVVVCKTSMLIDWGVHLPSIYMHCPRSINGFSSMQGIYAWLYSWHLWEGPSAFYIYALS